MASGVAAGVTLQTLKHKAYLHAKVKRVSFQIFYYNILCKFYQTELFSFSGHPSFTGALQMRVASGHPALQVHSDQLVAGPASQAGDSSA